MTTIESNSVLHASPAPETLAAIHDLDCKERNSTGLAKGAVGHLLNMVRQWAETTDFKTRRDLSASIKRQREVVRGLGVEV